MSIFDYGVFASLLHALATLISTSFVIALALAIVAHVSRKSEDDGWLKYLEPIRK